MCVSPEGIKLLFISVSRIPRLPNTARVLEGDLLRQALGSPRKSWGREEKLIRAVLSVSPSPPVLYRSSRLVEPTSPAPSGQEVLSPESLLEPSLLEIFIKNRPTLPES